MTPLRARLMSPPNAVPDTGINMRNGRPCQAPEKPVEALYVVGVPDAVRLENERLELLIRRRHRGPRIDPTVVPTALRWSTQMGGEPNIIIPERYTIPRHIIFAVAKAWDIRPDILTGSRREAFAIVPRHAAIAIIYRLSDLGLSKVGQLFGGRNTATVVNARRKMADHMAELDLILNDQSPPMEWVRALKARLEA